MEKVEFANIVYEWLKSEEKIITVSWDDHIGKRTVLLVKIPCTKKGMEGLYTVISGEITDIDDWCSTRNFSRVGYWLPEKEIVLEDKVHSYNFFEVNYHFVSEEILVLDFQKFAKKKVFDFYVRKYPTLESLSVAMPKSETVQDLQSQIMDMDWLKETMPNSLWLHFDRLCTIDWGLCNITPEMCIRELSGEKNLLNDLFITPYLDENCVEMKKKIARVKESLANAYVYYDLTKHYKPSTRAICTKKIVDAVKAFLAANEDKNIQNFKVTSEFNEKDVECVSIKASHLSSYEMVYDPIDSYWKKCVEKEYEVKEPIMADKIIKITYGKKVVYSRDK